jgi:hypothetical protein
MQIGDFSRTDAIDQPAPRGVLIADELRRGSRPDQIISFRNETSGAQSGSLLKLSALLMKP